MVKKIVFNKDKTVTVTQQNPDPTKQEEVGTTLSKEQYKAYNEQQTTGMKKGSPEPDEKTLALVKLSNLVSQMKRPTINTPQAAVNIKDLKLAEEQVPAIQQFEEVQPKKAELIKPFGVSLGGQRTADLFRKGGTGNTFNDVGTIATDFVATFLDSFNSAKNLITGQDSPKVKDARKAFSDNMGLLNDIIPLVESGDVKPEKALRLINDAVSMNLEIESSVKKKGLDNLQYWIRDGLALETEISANREELEINRIKLINAIATRNAQINQQAQLLGDIETITRRLKA